MRYKIMRRGNGIHSKFAEADWLADACWIVRSLSATSPVVFDIYDTVTGSVYQHEFALRN